MNDITNNNPYLVVGAPNYATSIQNMFGDKSPTQGQQANQQNKAQQPPVYDFAAALRRLFGQQQPGQPMQLGQLDQGSLGGTGGGLGGLY